MSNMNVFFSFVISGYGLYCLYLWLQCRRKGKISNGCMLVPKEETMETCIDPAEFCAFILPRLLIFGILVTLFGLLGIVDAYTNVLLSLTGALPAGWRLLIMELVLCVVPLGIVIWFGVCLRRVHKKLWVM